ncbi:flagellar hook-basal body complex protein FliE [Flavobacteriaceae bacterium]|nr:flagellar hook-basal body complex protein FliE [Flavobacteriaceae bacterium]
MAIMPIAPIEAVAQAAGVAPSQSAGAVNFSDWLGAQIQQTDQNIQAAESQVRALALGEADNLHQVMIALSKAKTSFELTVQVRNKVLEGLQEVMRMSI